MRDGFFKQAHFLVSAEMAASFNLQTYAYDGVNGTVRTNVTVQMVAPEDDDRDDSGSANLVSDAFLYAPRQTGGREGLGGRDGDGAGARALARACVRAGRLQACACVRGGGHAGACRTS